MMSRNLIFVCLFQPVSIEEENLPIRGTTREVLTHLSMQLVVIFIFDSLWWCQIVYFSIQNVMET